MRLSEIAKRRMLGKRMTWLLALAFLFVTETFTSNPISISWPNEVQIIPDSSNAITMPKADVILSISGVLTAPSMGYVIRPGDYISILSNVQSCGSTMDMRNGVLIGLGMISLDSNQHATVPLSLVPVAKYSLCVCPLSSTQVISGVTVCRDQAGSDPGIKVSPCFIIALLWILDFALHTPLSER